MSLMSCLRWASILLLALGVLASPELPSISEVSEALPPGREPVHVELRLRSRTPQHDNEQGFGVLLDVDVLGVKEDDAAVRVMADFDNGAIRLWQAPAGSRSRSLLPLGLCQGDHSVAAWAVDQYGNLSAHAASTFTIQDASDHTIPTASSATMAPRSSTYGSLGGRDTQVKSCDALERQPQVLLRGGDRFGEQTSLCRVCAIDQLDPLDPVGIRYGKEDGSVHWLRRSEKRRRLVLSTSLRVVTNLSTTDTAEEGGRSQEWPIELREGDSPALAARQFVATRLGLGLRPEGTMPEVADWPHDKSDSLAIEGGGEEGERVVQWVMRRLEHQIMERQARRTVARTEAARRISEAGQLRIVLGAVAGDETYFEEGDWLGTDADTLDVTETADFESLLGVDGLADAFLAEHVWEHLPLEDAHRAARNCYRYLRPGGRLRLAVPDPDWHTFPLEFGATTSASENSATEFDYDRALATEVQAVNAQASSPEGGFRSGERHRNTKEGNRQPDSRPWAEAREAGSRELPVWMSPAMLTADIRDGHLVQFTPELLANVCWSAGFTPILVEGRRTQRQTSTSKIDAHRGAGAGRTEETGLGPGGGDDFDADSRLWGLVKRSVAGGDPRGPYSIVMDCIKPTMGFPDSETSTTGAANPYVSALQQKMTRANGESAANGDPTSQPSIVQLARRSNGSRLATAASAEISETYQDVRREEYLPAQRVGYTPSETGVDVAVRNGDGDTGPSVVSGAERALLAVADISGVREVPHSAEDGAESTVGFGGYIPDIADDPVTAVHGTIGHRRNGSFAEWVAAERQKGRVFPACMYGESVAEPLGNSLNSASTATALGGNGFDSEPEALAAHAPSESRESLYDVNDMRMHARQSLLRGELTETLELCNSILQVTPSDAVALLYQGAALARRGEWILARTNMERVLAMSSGSDRHGREVSDRYFSRKGDPNHDTKEKSSSPDHRRVPLDITLSATVNMAYFARLGASDTRDPLAEMFFLLEGIRVAERRQNILTRADGRERSADYLQQAAENNEMPGVAATSDGLVDVFLLVARSLEEQGQLTSASRLYQRVVLLDDRQQSRVLQGFGRLSRRLKQLKSQRRSVVRSQVLLAGNTSVNVDGMLTRNTTSPSAETTHEQCGWSILHPRGGEIYSPDAGIPVEFDLALVDPGAPVARSLFASMAAVNGHAVAGSVATAAVGMLVCSYLEGFLHTSCLPRAELRDIGLGWHVLTAEAFVIPSLEPFRCSDSGGSAGHSVRRVRFCVGDDALCKQKNGDQDLHWTKRQDPPPFNVVETAVIQTPSVSDKEEENTAEMQLGAESSTAGTVPLEGVELPFCFLTLALNAMPFLTHHVSVFREAGEKLSKRVAVAAASSGRRDSSPSSTDSHDHLLVPPESFWEWHIVEGVAAGRADHRSPYYRKPIPDRYFDPDTGLSVDGTTEYLNDIRNNGAERVRVHRRCADKAKIRREAAGHVPSTARNGGPEGQEEGIDEHECDTLTGEETSYFWRDKIEMVNTAVFSLEKECLLVQIDSDELWTADQLVELRDMFLQEREESAAVLGQNAGPNAIDISRNIGTTTNGVSPSEYTEIRGVSGDGGQKRRKPAKKNERECAYFDCHFFIGPNLVTVTEDGWGHNKSNEWLRAWVFRPSESLWLRHAPPELARYDEAESGWRILAGDTCIGRKETRKRGLVFTHYAYALEEQVRFKSEFYGHSASYPSPGSGIDVSAANGAVAEWKALQLVEPPVVLAEHLTWLRNQGRHQEPRLLTTIADRPPDSSVFLPIDGEAEREESRSEGADKRAETRPKDVAVIPLGPFVAEFNMWAAKGVLQDVGSIGSGSGRRNLSDSRVGSNGTLQRRPLAHERSLGVARGESVRNEESGETLVETGSCDFFHLVVDGTIFQVDAVAPKGIARVWANLIPAIVNRLSDFDDTCLTLLLRGLASPPPLLMEAFENLPSERFCLAHVPPYNPFFGFVSDQLMLSGAVRDVGGTAFVSTIYTQPFRATTPGVVQLLLIHDLLPEVFGWDMSNGLWLAKAEAAASASAVVAVSQHSAREFQRIYPSSPERKTQQSTNTVRPVWAVHNGVDTSVFLPLGRSEIDAFRKIAGLESGIPYVLIVGSRHGYKNAQTVYRAMEAVNTAGGPTLALVLVGGGPVAPEERDMLDGVGRWTHIGTGSTIDEGFSDTPAAIVQDEMLAAGYSGALALIQLSVGEGFGLTVLEAFACGCPVVASDIAPFREIAGLPERPQSTGEHSTRSSSEREARGTRHSHRSIVDSEESARVTRDSPKGRYGGAAASLGGGLILVDDPGSATQVWRAVRALMALDGARRDQISKLLVKRAAVFDSWQPLADALIKAAVVVR